MIWLLLTGAGLVAETVLIVALGRRAMASDDGGESLRRPTDRPAAGQAADTGPADVG